MTWALKQVGDGLGRAWQSVAVGGRDLASRCSQALTRFVPRAGNDGEPARAIARRPMWGLVAGDLYETDRSVVVEVEVPGVDRADCEVEIVDRTLRIRGEKRVTRDRIAGDYHVTERAFGVFERSLALPRNADTAGARASYRNGVLTVEFPKTNARAGRLRIA